MEEAYEKALETLRKNIHPIGFSASPEIYENYYSVWARDHSICTIAACMSKDKELIKTAKKGLKQLLKSQLDNGQVPSYIEIENKKRVYGGFGRITSIDSNLWVMISLAHLYRDTKDKSFLSKVNVMRFIRFYALLRSLDSNDCGLLELPLAGDWADIFDRSYHVLYGEVLYYQALKALRYLFKEALPLCNDPGIKKVIKSRIRGCGWRRRRTKKAINDVFWITKDSAHGVCEQYMLYLCIPDKDIPYYLSHLKPFINVWHHRIDVFGNMLAVLAKISDKEKTDKILRYILDNKINEPLPIKCLYPVVRKNDTDWHPIYSLKEKPHTYHNGGIWPLIAGFYIAVLAKNRKKRLARQELQKLAEYLKRHEWCFPEHVHGKTLKPLGRKGQAWSAAGYIIAYNVLFSGKRIF